jgi:hypothetical protein
MKIGFFETTAILQEKIQKEKNAFPFGEKLFLEPIRYGGEYDLVLSDKPYLPDPPYFRTFLCLIPGSAEPVLPIPHSILLRGGMNQEDPVTFSSIGDDTAMLCLQQEIFLMGKSIVPFEKKVPFDRNFSLYKNLASSFTFSLTELMFAEEL